MDANSSPSFPSRFKTDFSNGDTGFHLEFESEGCSSHLTKLQGAFQTPNYPAPYPHDTQCEWKIEVPFGNLVEVTLHDFDFETMPTCSEDGLIVRSPFLLFRSVIIADFHSFHNTVLEYGKHDGQHRDDLRKHAQHLEHHNIANEHSLR